MTALAKDAALANEPGFVRADLLPSRPAPPGVGGDARVPVRVTVALLLAGLAIFYVVRTDPEIFARYAPRMAWGLVTTVQLVVASVLVGALPRFAFELERPVVGSVRADLGGAGGGRHTLLGRDCGCDEGEGEEKRE